MASAIENDEKKPGMSYSNVLDLCFRRFYITVNYATENSQMYFNSFKQ